MPRPVFHAIILALGAIVATAHGESGDASASNSSGSPFDYRFGFWGGAFIANVETTVQWGGELFPGTEFGLESALDMADNESAFNGEFEWRFFRRHSLNLRYFSLKRDGLADAPFNIVIDDVTIPIGSEVSSSFDNDVVAAHYAFSIIRRDNLIFDIGIGLNVQDIKIAIISEEDEIDERGDVTAPLPTVDLGFDWAITPQWILSLDGGWFDLEIDDIKGEITELRGGITWKPWEKVGFNLAYNYFKVRGDIEEEGGFRGRLEYRFQGPLLGIVATF